MLIEFSAYLFEVEPCKSGKLHYVNAMEKAGDLSKSSLLRELTAATNALFSHPTGILSRQLLQ